MTDLDVALLQADDPVEDAPRALVLNRSRKGWARGYQPPDEAKAVIKSMSGTRLSRSALTAAGDFAALLALSVGGALAHRAFPGPAAWAVSVLAVLVIGRFGRAQECMLHESSHRNWQRSGRWNDVLANLLAGYPTASRVAGYRAQHVIHHAHLGSPEDPDIIRYEEFNLEELTGLGGFRLVRAIGRRLPRYNWGWYKTIGTNPATMARSGAWYLVVFGVVGVVAGSFGFAVSAWLHWLLGYALVLPVIRMIGEAGEHRYLAGDTVFNATISNLGWAHRWIVHPHGDGHHTLHHLWSSVPHHQIRRMHEALADLDRDVFGGQIHWRAKVLETPRIGLYALSISVSIAAEIVERHPEVLVGGFVASGLISASAVLGEAALPYDTAAELREQGLSIERVADHPVVAGWRAAISACGLKPSTYKGSVEQLVRRTLKSGPLHTPLPLVDVYCDVAARHLAPLGAYDVGLLPGTDIVLRLAQPEADEFHPLGAARDDEMPLTPNVAVYAAGTTIICWAYNCRDSRDTCLVSDTDVGLFLGEAVTARQHEPLRAAFGDLRERLAGAGATVGPAQFASADEQSLIV